MSKVPGQGMSLGRHSVSGMRLVASSVGFVAGLAGLEHGLFEILQGNVAPSGNVIDAIGPLQRLWEHGAEPAFTLVPNFLATGILATIVSLIFIVWATAFVERRRGTLVLGILSVAMFLVGGGFAPPICAIMAIVAAASIDKPLRRWRRILSGGAARFLAGILKPCLILFVALCLLCIELAIFGYPLLWLFDADGTLSLITGIGYITYFALGPLVLLAAVAEGTQDRAARSAG